MVQIQRVYEPRNGSSWRDARGAMFWVYVLYGTEIDRLYIGQTQDLKKRLCEHREGASFYTKRAGDWRLIHSEEFQTRSEAMRREKQLKTYRGREYLRNKYLHG